MSHAAISRIPFDSFRNMLEARGILFVDTFFDIFFGYMGGTSFNVIGAAPGEGDPSWLLRGIVEVDAFLLM